MKKRAAVLALALLSLASTVLAGFPGTDLILPAFGRVEGAGGSHFYTTVWGTNPASNNGGAGPVLPFRLSGAGHRAPPTRSGSLAPRGARLCTYTAPRHFRPAAGHCTR